MIHKTSISLFALAMASLTVNPALANGATVTPPVPAPAAAAPDVAAPGDEPPQTADDIIVTGTRRTGTTAAESLTPIRVLGAEELAHVGQPNLNQVLTQLVPSFTAQAFGGDTANLALSARLRGLSPNHTLVLVNGKRRHGTANLAVLGGPYQGAATADLDLISPGSISRIEVLEDGAAAQYGSDAIAGVINIILKDNAEGGDAYGTAGKTYGSGGETYAGSAHIATKLGDDGFINVTVFHRFHDFSQVGGLDRRVTDRTGTLLTTTTNPALSTQQQALYRNIPGFPFVNRINGDARSFLTNLQYNSGYDFGDFEVYSFGSYSRRVASAYENLRVPDRVIGSPVLGVAGTLTTPGELVPFPTGFSPREGVREEDYAFTGGVKGTLSRFKYDLSTTYGRDKNEIYTLDSANRLLFIDTHFTPRDFYDGLFKATEFTANADFSTDFDLGLTAPLNVAFGAEYRRNQYAIGSGDPGSIYKEGGQSYPGFRPSDAGTHSRENESAYVDVSATPVDGLKLDGAVRYEHYSDFGSQVIFKGTGRYDFSHAFALRGTVSTGFRAPTLAESYYSATNVSPTSAFVQLPANSTAAKLLGFQNLRPEKSTNFSAGAVFRAEKLTITVDAYQVVVRDRILGTGTLFSSGGGNIVIKGVTYSANFPVVQTAVVANGNILDPTVTQTGVNIFTNGADTRTRGVEATMIYPFDFGSAGKVNLSLSANYNDTKITRLSLAPTQLTPKTAAGVAAPQPVPVFDQGAVSNLETASPKFKGILSASYTIGDLSVTARGTLYGTTSNYTTPDGGTFYKQTVGSAVIGDLEVGYSLFKGLELSAGANNIFDKRTPTVATVPGSTNTTLVNGGNVIDAPLGFSPYGINGGYYYGRVSVKF